MNKSGPVSCGLILYTDVWVEPINFGTLVVKGLIFVSRFLASTETCADTKFRM